MMDDDARQRLKEEMEAAGFKMKPLSKKAGVNETFMRDVLVNGVTPQVDNLRKVCAVIGTTVEYILEGSRKNATVNLIGHVGAGAQVYLEDPYAMGDGARAVEAPPNRTKDTVAVEVRGDSMAGRAEDGWLLYFDDRQEEPTPEMIGKLCIVWLEDDRVLVKKLYKGSGTGLWSLLSTTTDNLETDLPVRYAALVKWIKPT